MYGMLLSQLLSGGYGSGATMKFSIWKLRVRSRRLGGLSINARRSNERSTETYMTKACTTGPQPGLLHGRNLTLGGGKSTRMAA